MTVTLCVLADPVQRGGKQTATVTETTAAEPEIKLRVLEFNKSIFLVSFASKQAHDYPTGSTIFLKMKFRSKMTKVLFWKICPKKSSLRYQEKSTLATYTYMLWGEKNQASVHRWLFFNSSGLKAAAHISNIIGKEESRNISITQQRGLSGSGYFSFVAFCSQQLPTYSLSGDISGVHQNILLHSLHCWCLSLIYLSSAHLGVGLVGGNRKKCVRFIMILAHLPAFCQPANIYIRPAGFLHLLGFFLQLIQPQYSPHFHTFQMSFHLFWSASIPFLPSPSLLSCSFWISKWILLVDRGIWIAFRDWALET